MVGIFLFGIQTYFLSKAFSYLIRIAIFSVDPTILDQQIFLVFFLGMNLIDWTSIIIAIILQGFLFSAGMNVNKRIIIFSAIAVYFGMLLFFLSVLLSDVKFTSQAFLNILNTQNFLDKNNFKAYLNRGMIKGALRDFEGAFEDLNKANSLDPNKPEYFLNLGIVYASINKPVSSIESFLKAI